MAVHYFEDPIARNTGTLCREERWYSVEDDRSKVTCKRCLSLMKLRIEDVRAARERVRLEMMARKEIR